MPKFEAVSPTLTKRMEYESEMGTFLKVGFDNKDVVRRQNVPKDRSTIWRQPFVHDIDKIMHSPYFNRYADKTQVYSFYKNDDLTRRSLHVQLVSRIARTIGSALHLNVDLIEAIALGHDMGHPPFAHTGEKYLDELFSAHCGKHFLHNIQSVRVFDKIFPHNISLQTLHGIASHNGEVELEEYVPAPISSFEEFDKLMEECLWDTEVSRRMLPCTLEAAVVRISDIIAYLGKDRQDAIRTNTVEEQDFFNEDIGSINSEIINNLVVNIIESSYGERTIKLDKKHFNALRQSKRENYEKIYNKTAAQAKLDLTVKPMMADLYDRFLFDLDRENEDSPVYTQHISFVERTPYKRKTPYFETEKNQIVVDFISSMTDDYFVEIHKYLFPDSNYPIVYRGYFDDITKN